MTNCIVKSRTFFDTNVLVYFAAEAEKAAEARALLLQGGTISVQVLNEIALVCRRKLGYSWPRVRKVLALVRWLLNTVPLTVETHELGLEIAERYGFRIYDSILLASALLADCDTFWSEDMQHGMLVEDRLTIRNPFLQA